MSCEPLDLEAPPDFRTMAIQQIKKMARKRGCEPVALQHRSHAHGDLADVGCLPTSDIKTSYHSAPAWDSHVCLDDIVDEVCAIAWIIWESSGRAPHGSVYHAVRAVLRGESFEEWTRPRPPSVRELVKQGMTHREARELARELSIESVS